MTEAAELFDQCARVSGASLQTRVHVMRQFKQCEHSGVAGLDEFRMIAEENSYFTVFLADFLDVTLGGLRLMADARELSFTAMADALSHWRVQIAETSTALPLSFDERAGQQWPKSPQAALLAELAALIAR